MTSLALKLLLGAAIGAVLGGFGRSASGRRPRSGHWTRGALYGAALGLVFHFVSGGAGAYPPPKNIKSIPAADFDAEVLRAGKPVVVDFFATWCGPCKTLSPRLDALAGEYGDRIKFVSVDVDHAQSLASRYNVEGIPTLLFFGPDGALVHTTVGLLSVEALRAKLESLSTGPAPQPGA